MKKYREMIRKRIWLSALAVLLAVGFGIFDVFCATEEMKESEIFGFQCGLILGLGVLALIFLMRYRKALRSDKELQIQYNKEKDERMSYIRAKAGMPMVLITSVLMVIAGTLIGYFNIVIFYTLVAAALSQLVIACVVKFIYRKKI